MNVEVRTASGCAWTAVSNDPSWITITGGASGSGNGSVTYSVGAGSTFRTGTMTVAGQTVTVYQGGLASVMTVAAVSAGYGSTPTLTV